MKAKVIFPLMAAVIILSSCSANNEKFAQAVYEKYSSLSGAEIKASVSAAYGGECELFDLNCAFKGETWEINVLSPAEIKGIVIRSDEEGKMTLEYDGAELYAGRAYSSKISPLTAVPVMLGSWQTGLVSAAGSEFFAGSEHIALYYFIADGISMKTLFDKETLLPAISEIYENGECTVSAEFAEITAHMNN